MAAAAVVAIDVMLDPESWRSFVAAMLQQAESTNDAPYIGDQLLSSFRPPWATLFCG
jgi:hypothetical protein